MLLLPRQWELPESCSQGLEAVCAQAQAVLRELLIPRQWKPSEDRSFFLDAEQVNTLCDQAERVFLEEPTVLRLRGESPLPSFCDTF